jgi:hypothetical protein
MTLPDLSFALFSLFNALRLISYVPQIASVARDRNGATSISLICWSIWIGANGATALYAWVNLADPWLLAINGFNTLCCLVVVLLTLAKRTQLRRAHRASAGDGAIAAAWLGSAPERSKAAERPASERATLRRAALSSPAILRAHARHRSRVIGTFEH